MKYRYSLYILIFITFGVFLSSCSKVTSIKVPHSFQVAKNVNHNVNNFDKVKFEPYTDLNLSFFKGNLWIKLTIENELQTNASYMLLSNDNFVRNYRFYKLDNLKQSFQLVNHVNDTVYEDYRTFNNPNPNFKIDLAPDEKATYLITTASDGRTKDANLKLISLKSYYNFVSENTIWSIIFYSIIIFLLLINLYLFSIYRQKIYLYYLFYLISTLFVYLGIEGFLIHLNLSQLTIDHLVFIFVKLWALSLIMYTSKFLEIDIVAPKYYKFIKIVLSTILGGTLLYQFAYYNTSIQHLHYFENVLTILWFLLIIGILILSAKTRWLELKYYLIPFTFFIMFTVFGVVNVHLQLLAGNSFTYVKIGAIFEFIGFTYFMTALIKRRLKKSEILEDTLKRKEHQLTKKIESTDLISVFNLIEKSLSSETDWNEFKIRIHELNPNFLDQLLKRFPDLTKSEIRLLILIRVGYSQKEIAKILSIAPDSVKKARSRVRKKINLNEKEDLVDYLKKL